MDSQKELFLVLQLTGFMIPSSCGLQLLTLTLEMKF